jgi:hypothetical protein
MTLKIEKVFSYDDMKNYTNSIINAADFRADCSEGVRTFFDYQPGFDQGILTKSADGVATLMLKSSVFDMEKTLNNPTILEKLERFLDGRGVGKKFLVDCKAEKGEINVICDEETGEPFIKLLSFPPKFGDIIGGEKLDNRCRVAAWGGKKFIYFHIGNPWLNIAYVVAISHLFLKPKTGRTVNDKLVIETIGRYLGLPIELRGDDISGVCRPSLEKGLPPEILTKLELILKNTNVVLPKEDTKLTGLTCSDFVSGRVPPNFQGELLLDFPIGKAVYRVEAILGGKSVRVFTKDPEDSKIIEDILVRYF